MFETRRLRPGCTSARSGRRGTPRLGVGADAGHAARGDPWRAGIPFNTRGSRAAPRDQHASDQGLGLAMSPDGLKVVFVARYAGQAQLWLRSLDSASAYPLPGTERAASPFWSPDSRSIGFIAETRLKRMDIDGGSVRTLASGIPVALGGSWNRNGTIIFGNNPAGRFSASPTRVGTPDRHACRGAATTRSFLTGVPPRRPALSLLRRRHPGGARSLCRPA